MNFWFRGDRSFSRVLCDVPEGFQGWPGIILDRQPWGWWGGCVYVLWGARAGRARVCGVVVVGFASLCLHEIFPR